MIERREPLKRSTKPLKRSQLRRPTKSIAQYSPSRRTEIPARSAVVEYVTRRDRGACQAKDRVGHVRCAGPLDPHEIIPRSAWRLGYLDPTNIIMVCRAHHDWIGDHPKVAHLRGLHGFSWEVPQ